MEDPLVVAPEEPRRTRRPSVKLPQLAVVQKPEAVGFSLSETGTFSKGGFMITSAGIKASPLGPRDKVSQMRYADLVVLRTLGSGASSVVKVAKHTPTGKLIALKVLNMMADAATREQAVNELRVLHACACPHLLSFFDAFYEDGSLMIALALARSSLADVFAALRARAGVAAASADAARQVQAGLVAASLLTQAHAAGGGLDAPAAAHGGSTASGVPAPREGLPSPALAASACSGLPSSPSLPLRLRGAAAQAAERALAIEAQRVADAAAAARAASSIRLPERVLAALLCQALAGLAYLHSVRHQVHRDLKPANMLLSEHGVLTLSDFGIAKTLDNTRGMATSFVGTALYMAPERISGDEYSYGSDIWSLGIVGLEGARGVHPFSHLHSYYDLVAELSSVGEVCLRDGGAPLPATAAHFLQQCMRKRAADRPTAEELLAHPLMQLVGRGAGGVPTLPTWAGARDGSEGGAHGGSAPPPETAEEAEALRLGAIVRDWLDDSQLELAPVVTDTDLAAAGAKPAAEGAPAPAPMRRQISAKMSELERQLSELR